MTKPPQTIDRESFRPLWQQIVDVLTTEIRDGTLADNGKLPPAKALAERFGVNRHTVRQALIAMEEAGITESRQGAGSFVVAPVVNYPIASKTRFSEIVLGQGMEPSGEVVRTSARAATREIAEALSIAMKDQVIQIQRTCRADDMIIGFARHYFPAMRFPDMAALARKTTSISEALRQVGIGTYFRRSTTVLSRMPTAQEAQRLQQPISRPVLVTQSINVDSDGNPIEFGVTVFASDRVRLNFSN